MTPEEIIDRNNKLYHPEMDAKYVRLESAIKSMHDYNRDFKSALREEIEKEKKRSLSQTTRSHNDISYEFGLDFTLRLLDSITPKK